LTTLGSGQEWYKKHELLEAAQSEGFTVTEFLLEDWIEKGLLGQAQRIYLGRGSGSESYWPHQQLSLFLDLLRGRQEKPPNPIGQLAMFPIWRWLYLGDQGGVVLDQIRRAMQTWVTFRKRKALERIRAESRTFLKFMQEKGTSGILEATKELTTLYTFEQEMDEETLAYHLKSLMPHPRTLHGEIGISAAWYAKKLLLVGKSYQQYEQLANLDDFYWEWARVDLLAGHAHALAHDLHKDIYGVRWTAYESLEAAPRDLLGPLSMAAWDREDHTNLPTKDPDPLAPVVDLLAWQARKVSSKIESDFVCSPLKLPDGSNHTYLHTAVHLHLSGEEKEYGFDLFLPLL